MLGHYPPSSTAGATGGERAQAKGLLNPRAESRLPRFTLLPTLPEMKAPGSMGQLPSNPKAKHQQTGKTELGKGRMCRGGEFSLLSRIRPTVSPPFTSRHPRDPILSHQRISVPQRAPSSPQGTPTPKVKSPSHPKTPPQLRGAPLFTSVHPHIPGEPPPQTPWGPLFTSRSPQIPGTPHFTSKHPHTSRKSLFTSADPPLNSGSPILHRVPLSPQYTPKTQDPPHFTSE